VSIELLGYYDRKVTQRFAEQSNITASLEERCGVRVSQVMGAMIYTCQLLKNGGQGRS
jgi:hypothetical protein